ncbi:MAG: response regulator [Thermodesulfovibrionales bacterium]|jgi:CheY-like chemotaxis protein
MPHRLIVADDSSTIQKVVELFLEQEGFDVRAAGNGEEALELMQSFVPDIILADTDMPGMGGYELCGRIKADPQTSRIPVIILYSGFEPFDESRATAVGAQGVLAKPFESQDLIDAIQPLLSGEAQEAAPAAVETPEPRWDEDIPVTPENAPPAFGLDEDWDASGIRKPLPQPVSSVPPVEPAMPDTAMEDLLKRAIREEIPLVVERLVRENLTEIMASMRGVIEEAVREGIPRAAGEIIRKEIERIVSQTEDHP